MAKDMDYVDPGELIIIGLDTDHRAGSHPLFDERAFLETDEALVKNIMVYGIQQPVMIHREAGQMFVVDGRQRVKASREAAKRQGEAGTYSVKVPVLEAQGDDKRTIGIMVSLNAHRTATEMLDNCAMAVRMLDQGMEMGDLVIAFGKSKTTIKGWLDLAKASPKLHAALKTNKISGSAAMQIAKLTTREEQDTELGKLLGTGERISEAKAKKARQVAAGTAASDSTSALAAPGETETLPPELGAEPTEPGKAGKPGTKPKKGKAKPGRPRKETITSSTGAKKTAGRVATQSGVKRTWLRKAIKTKAAETLLTEEQMKVVKWFAYGESEKGMWFDNFMFEAELELGEAAKD